MPDAQVFHTINHGYPWPNGPHAFSTDGGWSWRKAPNERGSRGRAYGPVANFTDGPSVSAGCRERPSLIFAKDGHTPIALVNGFSPNPADVGKQPSGSCRYDGVDYSYTLVQPLRQRASAGKEGNKEGPSEGLQPAHRS